MLEFEWDEDNLRHLARHNVTPGEVEETLNGPALELYSYPVDYEQRFEEVGMTRKGRILKVVATLRDAKIRVVTAYDANSRLRLKYLSFVRSRYE